MSITVILLFWFSFSIHIINTMQLLMLYYNILEVIILLMLQVVKSAINMRIT